MRERGSQSDMRNAHTRFPGLVTLSLGSAPDNPLILFRGNSGNTGIARFKSYGEKYSYNPLDYVLPVLPE